MNLTTRALPDILCSAVAITTQLAYASPVHSQQEMLLDCGQRKVIPYSAIQEADILRQRVAKCDLPPSSLSRLNQRWQALDAWRRALNSRGAVLDDECEKYLRLAESTRSRASDYNSRCGGPVPEDIYNACLEEQRSVAAEIAARNAELREYNAHLDEFMGACSEWVQEATQLASDARDLLAHAMESFRGADLIRALDRASQLLRLRAGDLDTGPKRCSAYFRAVGSALADAGATTLGPEWTDDRLQANEIVGRIQNAPREWQRLDWADVQKLADRGVIVVAVRAGGDESGHLAVAAPTPPGLRPEEFGRGYPFVRDGNVHPSKEGPKKPGTLGSIPANYAFADVREVSWYVWTPSKK